MPTVANMDVASLCDLFALFALELQRASSAGLVEFNPHDKLRAQTYLDFVKKRLDWICLPDDPLDLSKSFPTSHSFNEFIANEAIDVIENLAIKDVLRRFKAAYVDLAEGQSKDRTTGLVSHDQRRLEALIENTKGLIENSTDTLDIPENPNDTGPTLP